MDEPMTKKAKLDKSAKEGKPCNINLNNCSVVLKGNLQQKFSLLD